MASAVYKTAVAETWKERKISYFLPVHTHTGETQVAHWPAAVRRPGEGGLLAGTSMNYE